MIQKIAFKFFVLSLLIGSFSCDQTSRNNDNPSINTESVKTMEVANDKSTSSKRIAIIYRSNDMGANWSPFDNGIPNEATLSGIKPYGNKVYIATDYHGVFVSTNGQDNWTSLNDEQLNGLDINCIEVEGNNILLGTLEQGIIISKDGGISWKPSELNIKSPIRAFISLNDKLYAGTDAGIFESIDMGNTWSNVFEQVQILGFTSLNEKIYAATQRGVLLFDGHSENWKSIYDGDALHDIGTDGQYIYAMTLGQQLLKTRNDGALWEKAQNGIAQPPNFYTNELQHVGNHIFSAQWIGIYKSVDNGNSWTKLDGLPDSTAFSTLEITKYGIIAGISIR